MNVLYSNIICCHLRVNDIQTMSNIVGYIGEEQGGTVEILRKLKYPYNKTLNNQISINGHKHICRHPFICRDAVDINRYMERCCQNLIKIFISHTHIFFMDGIDTVEGFLQIINTYGSILDSHDWN